MIVVGVLGIVFGCGNGNQTMDLPNEHSRQAERDWMVDTQIVGGGITANVLDRPAVEPDHLAVVATGTGRIQEAEGRQVDLHQQSQQGVEYWLDPTLAKFLELVGYILIL